MNTTCKSLAATALAGLLTVSCFGAAGAGELSVATIKPVSGHGSAPDQKYLHSAKIGAKQAVSYFTNDQGLCRVTLMVGSAFNGEDVPDMTTVRFEAVIGPGKGTRFDTVQGESLEFACHEGGRSMSVRALEQTAAYTPRQ